MKNKQGTRALYIVNTCRAGFVFSIDLSGNYTCLMCKRYNSATLYITVFQIPSPC